MKNSKGTGLILLIILVNVGRSQNADSSTSETTADSTTSSESTTSAPLTQPSQTTFCPADETDQVEFPWAEDTLKDSYGEIIFVSLAFRHADRSPVAPFPSDIHANYRWPRPLGTLVKKGLWRAYRLGGYMRSRYSYVSGSTYDDRFVAFHTIDLPRCVESGQLAAMGMFPANDDQNYIRWNEFNADGTARDTRSNCTHCMGYYAKPIYMSMNRSWDDNTLALRKKCKRYDELNEDYWEDDESVEEFCKDNIHFFNYSMIHAGFPNDTQCRSYEGFWSILRIYDTLLVHKQNDLEWPDWAKDESYPGYFEMLRKYSAKFFQKQADDEEIKKLLFPLARLILEDMRATNAAISSGKTQTLRVRIYSAQDLIIETIRKALNLPNDDRLPTYSSFIAFEMRKKDENIFVTVSYQNDTNKAPYAYTIPGCGDVACSLEKFCKILENSSTPNWEAACQLDDTTTSTTDSSNTESTTENTSTTDSSKKKKKKRDKKKKRKHRTTTEASANIVAHATMNQSVKFTDIFSYFIPYPYYR